VRDYLPRHRLRELDDAYGDVVLARCQDIMRNYDPAHVSSKTGQPVLPISFLLRNVGWYALEWALDRKYKKKVPTVPLTVVSSPSIEGEDTIRDELTCTRDYQGHLRVSMVLERMPSSLADILRWTFLHGCDDSEIAKHLGIRRGEAKRLREEALAQAQRAADGLDGDGTQWASYGEGIIE